MEIGAQLYTLRAYTQNEKDFRETIQRVAEMGYETVQLSAIGKAITPSFAREVCDENNVRIVLTHSDPERIVHDTEQLIREHELLGAKYIGIGSMPEKYQDPFWIHHFAEDFLPAARMIRDAGMKFMYHSHDFEYERFDGKLLFDEMLADFSPEEMGVTLDTYWCQTAGADVVQWIQKLTGRLNCVHLKDRAVVKREPIMAPVGEGVMNFPAILQALDTAGCEYALVEQDVCLENPFLCMETSRRNLREMGY